MTKTEKKDLLEIAKRNMIAIKERGDLNYRHNDEEDFVEVSVGSIEEALEQAYNLGIAKGKNVR